MVKLSVICPDFSVSSKLSAATWPFQVCVAVWVALSQSVDLYCCAFYIFSPETRHWCSRAASSADKVNLNMKILNYFGALGVWRGTRTCSRVHWGHMPHGSDYSYCTESKHFSCPKLSKYRKLWAWVRHISYSSPSLLNAHQAGHQPQKSNKWEIAI